MVCFIICQLDTRHHGYETTFRLYAPGADFIAKYMHIWILICDIMIGDIVFLKLGL